MRNIALLTFIAVFAFPQISSAEPLLQLYLEGGTYDQATESWTLTPYGSSGGAPFRIWAIGNTSKATIYDVKLAISYSSDAEANGPLNISLTPSTMGGTGSYNGFTEGSATTLDPFFIQRNTSGDTPQLGGGGYLSSHGVYGDGVFWQEFGLGDFDQEETLIGDFTNGFAGPGKRLGQINVYDVTVTGSSIHPTTVHFDLYDHVEAQNGVRGVFAPFSHDADATAQIAPVPSAAMMLLTAVFGLGGMARFRRWFSKPSVA